MSARVRAYDWASTPLGPMASWPQSLRVAVGICLNSRFPMFVWWGERLINIYNDAYIPVLGKRHPIALGRPAKEIWHEIWPVVGPQADAVMLRGEATWNERVLLVMERHGYTEETYFTWSYSPIPDDAGTGIGGLFCACTEETQRVRAEERVTGILESITDAFFALDKEWRFTYVNAQAQRVLDRSDLLGKDIWQEYPGLLGSAFETAYRTAARQRVAQSVTAFYPDHDRWYEIHAYPATDGGVSVYFRDVSAGRQDEAALRASEARYRTLFESIDQGFCIIEVSFDGDGRPVDYVFVEINPAFERQTGLRDAVGKRMRELAPDHEQHWFETYGRIAMTGQPARFVHEARALGRWYDVYAYRVGGSQSRKVGVLFNDITERRQAEEAVREGDERLRLAVAIAQMGTFLIDLRTDAVTVNDIGRQIYGWDEGEPLTFSKVQTHFHADDRDRVMRAVGHAFEPAGPGEFEVEQRIIRRDGAVRWVRVRGRAAFEEVDGHRQAVRCIGTYIDVTEQKEAERQREQLLVAEKAARAEAERASEAKSEFLATLSHELRTPLTPVLLTVSLMESNPALPAELREDVATIRRNVELESRLISDLLDLTRVTRGKLQLDTQDVDLHLILRAAIDICQREASAKLVVDLAAKQHVVRGDSTRLQQIFWNLINNAMKFTGTDGTVTVRTADAGDRVRVEVIDSGVGIDPSVLPRLFNAFEQGDVRTQQQQAGLGLGLAISKKLTEAHGGTITAASAGRGRGALFTVELPVVTKPLTASPARSARPGRSASAESLSVLVVEDHDATLKAMMRLLRHLGHRVTGATSVASATAAARQDGYDVIISDLGLPDGSGLDVIRALRDRYAGRAIALTGYGMESDIAASRDAGFAEHLTKPVDLDALEAAIARIIATPRPRAASRQT